MARKIDDELREMLKEEADELKQESAVSNSIMGKWFKEADDDTDADAGDEGETLEDIEKEIDELDSDDDSNDDEKEENEDEDGEDIGKDDSDVQNEYDDNDLNALNELIADEQHAMQAYFKAGKETKNVLLSRLYDGRCDQPSVRGTGPPAADETGHHLADHRYPAQYEQQDYRQKGA